MEVRAKTLNKLLKKCKSFVELFKIYAPSELRNVNIKYVEERMVKLLVLICRSLHISI